MSWKEDDITALFYSINEFCKIYKQWGQRNLISKVGSRSRTGKSSLSDMLFIMIMLHLSNFRNFKLFYEYGIKGRFEGHTDSYVFNLWIEKFLLQELEPGLVVILDNASFHKSLRIIELIKVADCIILFLPPH